VTQNAKDVYKYYNGKNLLTRTRIQEDYDIGVDETEKPFVLSSVYTNYRTI